MHKMDVFDKHISCCSQETGLSYGIFSRIRFRQKTFLLLFVADFEPANSPDVLHRGGGVNPPLKFLMLFPCCHHLFSVCQGILSVRKEYDRCVLIPSC